MIRHHPAANERSRSDGRAKHNSHYYIRKKNYALHLKNSFNVHAFDMQSFTSIYIVNEILWLWLELSFLQANLIRAAAAAREAKATHAALFFVLLGYPSKERLFETRNPSYKHDLSEPTSFSFHAFSKLKCMLLKCNEIFNMADFATFFFFFPGVTHFLYWPQGFLMMALLHVSSSPLAYC